MADTAPTLVLLSGLLCDERIWQPVQDALPSSIRATIRAFPGFRTIEAMATHVLESVPGPLIVVGHSMGGRVALEAAAQAPDRVVGLGLANTGTHPPAPGEAQGRQKLIDCARAGGMAALADAWLPPMMGSAAEQTAALMPELRAMVAANSLESYEGQIAALLARPDAAAALRAYRGPVLLLAAEQDRWSPPRQHQDMQVLAPQSELHILGDAGHMLPYERPAPVAALIGDWLAAHWPNRLRMPQSQ